ncbi:IS66 family insertion sequence element accessory protein TnpB [Bradyrhizobium sp. KBS0727]|nr:IS66 family insertion sequence element accessory protein TnpB [Bradyrhizobium sp. KBS0725]QDW48627.1 IS66 family insertion sequence element accessory protein TnpB [Bradyrhizobium sp. KBS0727]
MHMKPVGKRNPMGGGLFCFRGKRGDLLKVIWHDGQGACLFTKRLERGRFISPSVAGEAVTISPALLSYFLSPATTLIVSSQRLFPGFASAFSKPGLRTQLTGVLPAAVGVQIWRASCCPAWGSPWNSKVWGPGPPIRILPRQGWILKPSGLATSSTA